MGDLVRTTKLFDELRDGATNNVFAIVDWVCVKNASGWLVSDGSVLTTTTYCAAHGSACLCCVTTISPTQRNEGKQEFHTLVQLSSQIPTRNIQIDGTRNLPSRNSSNNMHMTITSMILKCNQSITDHTYFESNPMSTATDCNSSATDHCLNISSAFNGYRPQYSATSSDICWDTVG